MGGARQPRLAELGRRQLVICLNEWLTTAEPHDYWDYIVPHFHLYESQVGKTSAPEIKMAALGPCCGP